MADASSPAYVLRTPVAERGESITSQLQREILGDAAAPAPASESAANERDALPTTTPLDEPTVLTAPTTPTPRTPRATDDADLVAISTPEALPQQQLTQPETTATTATRDDRRRTLSPSKALAFFNQVDDDDEVVTTASRRDTVSPESIRSLLRGLNDADGASRRASVAAAMGLDPTTNLVDDATLNETRQDVERTKQYLETSKLAMRQSSPPSSKRRRTSGSTGRSATTDQDSFTDAFFSTNLLSHDEGGDNGNEDNTIESVDGRPINRRSTLEPTDAQAMLSEIQAEMVGTIAEEEKEEKAPTPHMATRRTTRQSTSPSPSPNTRSRKRRSTIDPTDLLAIHNGPSPGPVAATIDANRRDTIGDGELLVLQREFGLEATSTTESSRKRKAKTPSPARPTEGAAKRTRSNAMNAREIENEENPRRSTITPQKKQTMANADSLFSPPPTNRAKTPLKSCLSARKAKPKDDTTPNKSVNFGPPQATHFNRGSPSTSMTPMPEKDAVARFLLEPPPTEEEDAETAQNSSLLEEADGQGSSDDEPVAAAAAPPLVQRPQSIEPVVSARTRRRYSLRGVSPLDNQANARRQRRQSAMASSTPHQQSPLVSARNRRAFEAAATAAALAASRTASPARTSFMSVTDPTPQSRAAFADSSASSDEGEDMEITGDYTNHAATAATLQTGVRQYRLSESPRRSARVSARQDSLFPDSPLSDGTVEVTSLGDLVAEDYREEEKRQRSQQLNQSEVDDDDDDDVPSLALLAREGEDDEDQPQRNNFADRQAKNLQPITEGDDEDRRSSSAHSRMSLDSDEESDAEYDKKRKSLVVNLSSKFERSGSPKARKPSEQRTEVSSSLQRRLSLMASPGKRASPSRAVPSPSPQKLPDPLRIEEVFARVHFEEISREVVERVDASVLETDVQRGCVAHAALSSLRYSTKDVDSWCKGLAESIPSLAREKVSRVFSTDDPGALAQLDESIKSLQTIENVHVRSGYCQWRSKLEKTICDGLAQCENKLQSDVKTLRSMLDNDRSYRESELRAVKELMERERQMEQLLDGIEEQQAVQREYESSVQQLESGCSSLSLEASVLDQQLGAIEQSSPQSDMSEATESKLRRNVLELEELLAVRESVGMWRVLSATGSKLAIASRYEDVFFSIEVRVAIDTAGPGQRASFTVTPVFTTKTRRHKVDDESRFENDEDALSTIASVIVSKRQVERYESKTLEVPQLSSRLGELSTTLRRAYQYLSDLRSISTQFGMRLEAVDDNNCNMWIDFVRFPHVVPSGVVVDGVKFSVGHRLHFSWPYTDFDWHVQIAYGTLTEEKLRQQLNEVPRRSGHDYLTRVCQRLRDIFIQDS